MEPQERQAVLPANAFQSGHKSFSQAAKPHISPIAGLWFADLLGKEVLALERHTGHSSNTVRPVRHTWPK